MNWKDYQDKAAGFFRSLGLETATNAVIKGVRTKHNIDVLVRLHYAGFAITWIVECKYWRSKVSKLPVFGLREIVTDTGADKGILLAEHGVQSGAFAAAALTNVQITSLADLTVSANNQILSMRLLDIYDRLMQCKSDYWDIPKAERITHGLRPDTTELGYSGDFAIRAAEDLISKGLRGVYPIFPDDIYTMISPTLTGHSIPRQIDTPAGLLTTASAIVLTLESRLNAARQHKQ
jgi:restriction system protein